MASLYLIRHAPQINGGRLAGRRDVPADCSCQQAINHLNKRLPKTPLVWCSAALRCRQTADALSLTYESHADLWEQDYGVWEGRAFETLPDLGDLSLADLAAYRPDGGESFHDMVARVSPKLQSANHDTITVAHAGTVRAALSWVVGSAALSFQIAPLSLTILHKQNGHWSVGAVNLTYAE